MENQTEQLIGKVLHVDEVRYNRSVDYHLKLIPAIKAVITSFLELELQDFSKNVFFDLINGNLKEYSETYEKRNDDMLNKTNINFRFFKAAFHREAAVPLEVLVESIQSYKALYDSLKSSNQFEEVFIDPALFTFEKNDVFLSDSSNQVIKDHFSITIKTHNQAQAYACYLEVKHSFESFVKHVVTPSENILRGAIIGSNTELAMMYIDENKQLQFSPGLLHFIK